MACLMACCRRCWDKIVFSPAVDETLAGPHGVARNGHAFQDFMGVALHQVAVFDGARLPLVGVADDILGSHRQGPGERPLQAGGEPGPAPAPEPRGLDRLDDRFRGHGGHGLLQGRITAPVQVSLDIHGIDEAHIIHEHRLMGTLLVAGGNPWWNTAAAGNPATLPAR